MKRLLLATILISAGTSNADDDTFLDAASAGPDYAVQGEYTGEITDAGNTNPFGLQVIALGDHKFDGVAYPGGLPGAGWIGNKKLRLTGATKDGVTTLKSEVGTVVISNGKAVLTGPGDESLGTLKRIERASKTLGAKPPEGALVLFDGSTADHFNGGKITEGNLLAANCETKAKFGDHIMHLEFRTPFKPKARGQARGNSGVYLQSRYECQVLDSFGLEGKNNECGGIYSISEPAVNACFPPLTWQTYDIEFTAAKWKDGKKVANARATIRHNGIVIHDDLELPHGTPGKHPEGDSPDGLYLQGHGNPVVYRNIWVVEK